MKNKTILFGLVFLVVVFIGAYQFNRKKAAMIHEAVQQTGLPSSGTDEINVELKTLKEENGKLEEDLKTKEKFNASLSQLNTKLSDKVESIIRERDGLVLKVKTLLEEKKVLEEKAASIPKGSFAQTLKDKAALEIELKKLKANIESTRNLASEVSQAKSALEAKFQELINMRQELEGKLEVENQISDNLADTLAKEKRDSEAIHTRMSNIDQIVEEKLRKLDQIKNTLDEIAK